MTTVYAMDIVTEKNAAARAQIKINFFFLTYNNIFKSI
jgi:hypothetical protein